MPMGNDAVAVGRDNLLLYGDHLNVEDLIKSQAAQRNPALSRIQLEVVDEEETAKLRDDLSVLDGKVDLLEGERILDAAVRGNAFIAVIETPRGDTRKAFGPWNAKYEEPKLTAAEKAHHEAALADGEVAAETQRVREAAAQRLREQREQIEREAEAELQKIRRDAEERVAKARDEAEAGGEAASGSTVTKRGSSSSKKKTSRKKTSSASKRKSTSS